MSKKKNQKDTGQHNICKGCQTRQTQTRARDEEYSNWAGEDEKNKGTSGVKW